MTDLTPVVVAARRSPIGTAGHGLAGVDVVSLLTPVLAALRDDVAALELPIDDVLVGNCLGPGGNIARVAALQAGLGLEVPGTTVDRQCGSGQQAIHHAAEAVRSAAARLVLAGGAESASTAPWRLRRPATATDLPQPYHRAPFAPADLGDPEMGAAADDVARRRGVTRERQDAYAARSFALTTESAAAGVFDAELVPIRGVDCDDRPRRMPAAALARLRPAFTENGTATAGNSCGISDGAGMVAIVPEEDRARLGLPGLAIRHWVVRAGDPRWPGLGPIPAVTALLAQTGLTMSDVGVFEMTEAFAAQLLACTDALGLDPLGDDGHRVCPQGGAIALGHPWGASGALLMVRLFSRLVRCTGPRWGIATCAIAGGQGVALLVERVGP